MEMELREESMVALVEYAQISIAFQVDGVLLVSGEKDGLGGFVLAECKLSTPYVKDYDLIDGEQPSRWAERFDTSNWGLISAYSGGRRVGGTVIAFNTPGLEMLEGRRDLAVLWDIRVQPEFRAQGVGSALFRAVEKWAVQRGC